MNTIRLVKILTLVVLAAASNSSSKAALVTYWFSGVVENFQDPSNIVPPGITEGTPFVGRISYDPAGVRFATTNSSGGGVSSQYEYDNLTAFSFTVHIAGNTIANTVAPGGKSGLIAVEDNVSERDLYLAETASMLMLNGTNMVTEPNQAAMSLALINSDSTALTSSALPLAAPVLSQFSDGASLTILARNPPGTVELSRVSGPISVISTNEIVFLNFRRINSSTAQLAWPLYANGYTLQSSTSLTAPNWQNVGTAVVNTATEHTVAVSVAGPQRFYRLKK